MLMTVKDACELHPMALDYALSEQIENLSDVIERTEKEANEFFDKNYVTKECAGNNFPVFPKYVIKPSAWSQTGRRAAWTPMHRKSNGR